MCVAGQVDQQVAQQPVDQPELAGFAARRQFRHLLEGDFQFVKFLVTAFVDARRLAGGADEHAGEQVGQAGVVLPVADQTHYQIGPAQHRAVGRCGAAQSDMVTAAGAGVAAVEHEFFGGQPGQTRFFVKHADVADHLVPVAGRVDVDLNDARIGRDHQALQTPVARRLVAFQNDWPVHLGGHGLNGGSEFQIVFQCRQRWHEDAQYTATCLDTQRGVDDLGLQRTIGYALRLNLGMCVGCWLEFGVTLRDFAIVIGQLFTWREHVERDGGFACRRSHPGQAVQRQAQTHRRIAG